MTTYTIAFDTGSGLLFATVPDGADIDAAVAEEADNAGIDIPDYAVESGLTLTDDPPDGATVVYDGRRGTLGYIIDETGRCWDYAVRFVAALAKADTDGR